VNRNTVRWILGIAAFVFTFFWRSGDFRSQAPSEKVPVFESGVHLGVFRRPDLSIGYAISIPKGYSAARPVPLVLALHYGGSPNGAAQGLMLMLVQPALAELRAIIIAPQSVGGAWSTASNERAVMSLLDAVRAAYSIDARRIAVTGYSMGGSGTWFFAGKYPELFSVAIPVAGMPSVSAEPWKTPVFAVHSRNDEVMPIGPTEMRIKELQKLGVRAELVTLSGLSHSQTNKFVSGLKRVVPWVKETWK
jgi:predicted peptidase